MRGYGFQRAGPLDVFGNPIGGISSLDLGVELRTRINDTFGFVTFFEGGTVYDKTLPDLSQRLFWGTGVGLAYFSPIGRCASISPRPDRRPSDAVIQPTSAWDRPLDEARVGRILLYSMLGLLLCCSSWRAAMGSCRPKRGNHGCRHSPMRCPRPAARSPSMDLTGSPPFDMSIATSASPTAMVPGRFTMLFD